MCVCRNVFLRVYGSSLAHEMLLKIDKHEIFCGKLIVNASVSRVCLHLHMYLYICVRKYIYNKYFFLLCKLSNLSTLRA